MKLSRTAIGLAVRAARKVAQLTADQLAELAGMDRSSLSRTENGLRSLEFNEAVAISAVLGIKVEALRTLAETYQREGVEERMSAIKNDFNELQRRAVEAAIESAQS
jgi:transcriptional regulator with XRE-family HTH domain